MLDLVTTSFEFLLKLYVNPGFNSSHLTGLICKFNPWEKIQLRYWQATIVLQF